MLNFVVTVGNFVVCGESLRSGRQPERKRWQSVGIEIGVVTKFNLTICASKKHANSGWKYLVVEKVQGQCVSKMFLLHAVSVFFCIHMTDWQLSSFQPVVVSVDGINYIPLVQKC